MLFFRSFDSVSTQGLTINITQHEHVEKLQVEMHELHAISSLPPKETTQTQIVQEDAVTMQQI